MGQIKLSPRIIQIICGVIILVCIGVYVYVGLMYNTEQGEQDDLEAELQAANDKWTRIKDRPVEDLESILEQTQEKLAEVESIFPVDLTANDVMQLLIQAADEHGLNILPLSGIKPAKTVTVNDKDYWIVEFTLRPSGTLSQLLGFLESMEKGQIGGNTYASISISDVGIQGRGGSWQINFKGSIYSRIGEG